MGLGRLAVARLMLRAASAAATAATGARPARRRRRGSERGRRRVRPAPQQQQQQQQRRLRRGACARESSRLGRAARRAHEAAGRASERPAALGGASGHEGRHAQRGGVPAEANEGRPSTLSTCCAARASGSSFLSGVDVRREPCARRWRGAPVLRRVDGPLGPRGQHVVRAPGRCRPAASSPPANACAGQRASALRRRSTEAGRRPRRRLGWR